MPPSIAIIAKLQRGLRQIDFLLVKEDSREGQLEFPR